MQQSEKIAEYLEKAVPRMVSAKKYDKIRAELLSHILDKADFYIEIGYGKDAAYEKALEEMGEPEQVSTQFEEVYREKKTYCRIAFLIIIFADLFATVTGFGSSLISVFFKDSLYLTYDSLLISAVFLFSVVIAILYAYKEKHPSMLRTIGFAHLLLSILGISGSIYYPITLRFLEFLPLEAAVALRDLMYFTTPIITLPIFIICMWLASNRKITKRKTTISGKTAGVLTAVSLSLCILWCSNVTVSEKAPFFDGFMFKDAIVLIINSRMNQSELNKIYDSINEKTTGEEADRILRESGYMPHTELHTVISDEDALEYLLDGLEEYFTENRDNESVYLKYNARTNDFELGVVVIPECYGETISYKKTNYVQVLHTDIFFYIECYLLNKNSTEMARESFEKFHIGDSKKDVLKKMKRMCIGDTVMTEYTENGEVQTYTFETSEVRWMIDDVYFSFDCSLSFINDKLISGDYVYYSRNEFDLEDVYEEYREYTIEK
ncbi:MAG: hypothetical protein IKJ27_07505 [Clostridia bacterium]|nr:hypothetical protein [Clostridia bacterium]